MNPAQVFGDWGSTRLRLWRMREGSIVDSRDGPGIVGLTREPAEVLREALAPWLGDGEVPHTIRLCGMAGARGGLREVAYAECPSDVPSWRRAACDLALDGIPVRIAAGLATAPDSKRCEVMRGEETQVFGAVRLRPELAEGHRMVVHPGTHSKWMIIDGGRITDFRTFMTGELFALLQRSSLLSVGDSGGETEEAGFAEGLASARENPGLLGSMFHARAAQVRGGRGHPWATGYLSGLLIGSEATEQLRAGALPDSVVLIGEPKLTAHYARGLASFGVATEAIDGQTCVLAGLELLHADA